MLLSSDWNCGFTQESLEHPVPTYAVVTTTLTCNPWLVVWRRMLKVLLCVCVHLIAHFHSSHHTHTHTCVHAHTHTQNMWHQCTFCISTNTVNVFTFMVLHFLENLYCPSWLHTQLHNYNYTPHTTKTCNLCLAHCMWMRVGNINNVLHVYNTVFTPLCPCWQYGAHHWVLQ